MTSAEVYNSVCMARVIQLLLNSPRKPTKAYPLEYYMQRTARPETSTAQIRFSYKKLDDRNFIIRQLLTNIYQTSLF